MRGRNHPQLSNFHQTQQIVTVLSIDWIQTKLELIQSWVTSGSTAYNPELSLRGVWAVAALFYIVP